MFEKHITTFNNNILGLRQFVDLIAPFLEAKQKEHSEPIEKMVVLAMVTDVLKKKTNINKTDKKKYEALKIKLNAELQDSSLPIDLKIEEDMAEGDKKKGIKISFKGNATIDNHMENASRTKNHIELLYKNSLISLLTSVEWFFSEILHYYYNKFPDSAGIQKKTMTLTDLKAFGTINDAEKYLIDVKIEEILRGNFESWITILKTELSLKLGYIDPLEDELVEIYQRRNILVHNGGVVNSIYLAKVKDTLRKKIKLNDTIHIDKDYLDNAIRKLQKVFILIASELWKKLDKDDKGRGEILTVIVYDNLLKSRWDICEGLCNFIMNDSKLNPIDKIIAQLNYWLCKKRTNELESVKEDIKKADYSDKKEILQLGLLALKDDTVSFFKLLPTVLDSNQLTIDKLEEFPIFEEIRQLQEYKDFKANSKYFLGPQKLNATKKVTKRKAAANNSIARKLGRRKGNQHQITSNLQ